MDEGVSSFIGYFVSLACDNENTYEGEVGDIDGSRQLITLVNAHQLLPDGSSMKYPRLTLPGNHIKNLKIIRENSEKLPDLEELNDNKTLIPNKITQKNKSPKTHQNNISPPKHLRNRTCFGSEADKLAMNPDFDFEGNLAKFDKKAVYQNMLRNSEDYLPNGVPDHDKKMKSQENVLESEPVSLRQIRIPLEHAGKEYFTEDGFIIPAITLALKNKLFKTAEKAGLSMQQLVENAGISVCQMTLQLVGGSLRINPKNNHQRPEIVVMAGPHMQGLQAICAARHLANHTAKVTLYLPSRTSFMQTQINLFEKAGGIIIKSHKELPNQPVDIVIDGMIGLEACDNLPEWLPLATSWANQNKAPLLSIDPCVPSTRIELPKIKWSIAMSLPLIKAPKSGRLYLADLGIPRDVFKEIGIHYLSPFKDKFCIPLYD